MFGAIFLEILDDLFADGGGGADIGHAFVKDQCRGVPCKEPGKDPEQNTVQCIPENH